MKILWRKFGFTTNSSGSYEWLPGQATTSTSTVSTSTSNVFDYHYSTGSTSSLPLTTPAPDISLAVRIDLFIFLAAVLTGVISVFLLIKDILKSNKNKKHVNHQEGEK